MVKGIDTGRCGEPAVVSCQLGDTAFVVVALVRWVNVHKGILLIGRDLEETTDRVTKVSRVLQTQLNALHNKVASMSCQNVNRKPQTKQQQTRQE